MEKLIKINKTISKKKRIKVEFFFCFDENRRKKKVTEFVLVFIEKFKTHNRHEPRLS